MSDLDNAFAASNAGVWTLTASATAILGFRLWCRRSFAQGWWWDDCVLSISWIALVTSAGLLSGALAAGIETKRFFLLDQLSTTFAAAATTWSKCAFAITLWRLTSGYIPRMLLSLLVISANSLLAVGIMSVWPVVCGDPRAYLRPSTGKCWDGDELKFLGGTFIVYGGVVDVLLALFPWLIIRKLRLGKREKMGAVLAMSLGSLTGIVSILRAVIQFSPSSSRYYQASFVAIFNIMEPSITIIAQTIPMFRVLLLRGVKSIKRRTLEAEPVHVGDSSRTELVPGRSRDAPISPSTFDPDKGHEMLRVTVGPGGRIIAVPDDKV
ncbi:hypothetical protein F4779DRAFT_619367 [Xylariaceae sp. FL0662B]|nr:hypothetical protein F4779DRAFT_619367 [Xylariaceae sp. FL0662B]